MKSKRRTLPPKGNWNYHQLWRLVDGAVADAFANHPEYLSGEREEWIVRQSINKRVVGTILGYAEEVWGRSGNAPSCAGMAAEIAGGSWVVSPAYAVCKWLRSWLIAMGHVRAGRLLRPVRFRSRQC